MESYLSVVLSTFLGLVSIKLSGAVQIVASILVLFIFLAFVIFPFVFFGMLYKHKKELDDPNFDKKFGALYQGLRMD